MFTLFVCETFSSSIDAPLGTDLSLKRETTLN